MLNQGTDKVLPVRIVLKEGPVIIRSINGAGISAKFDLWDGIVASEFFPPNVNSAFYVLSLEKSVTQAAEVWIAEGELIKVLEYLAIAWPFSGGSFMILETRELAKARRYESNAQMVEAELLACEGLRRVQCSSIASYEVVTTYLQPPLSTATSLAKAMRDNPTLGKLFAYHQQAWMDYYYSKRAESASWFVQLYKVRDFLSQTYIGEIPTRSRLNISENDWKFFGTILNNNDFRHAEITGTAPIVTHQDVDRLFRLVRLWIQAHLLGQGLPVVPV